MTSHNESSTRKFGGQTNKNLKNNVTNSKKGGGMTSNSKFQANMLIYNYNE